MLAQELAPNSARVLEELFSRGHLDPRTDFNGMGLAFRQDMPAQRLAMPQPQAITARLKTPGGDVEVVCVRLPPPLRPKWVRARRSQLNSLMLHVNKVATPVVVAGDLNATPLWPAYKSLHRLLDDGTLMAVSGKAKPTWPKLFPLMRIDHVLVKSLNVERIGTVAVSGTDHLGIVVDVSA